MMPTAPLLTYTASNCAAPFTSVDTFADLHRAVVVNPVPVTTSGATVIDAPTTRAVVELYGPETVISRDASPAIFSVQPEDKKLVMSTGSTIMFIDHTAASCDTELMVITAAFPL